MRIANKMLVFMLALILTISMTVMAEEASNSAQTPEDPLAAADDTDVKTFETEDGVLSIAIPTDNDEWSVLQDDQRWFTMSDGTDTITVDHYSNGDTLPAVTVAKAPIVQVYQVYFSTENEVFVVTGEVTAAEDMPYVRDAVNSFEVLKYDTKQAAQPQPEANYDIREIGADMYCITTDGVNVRSSYSTSSDIIGGVSYGEKVYVIGEVTKDGADAGWLKIQYGDGEGYVHEEWFDFNEPSDDTDGYDDSSDTDQPADLSPTGDELTLYRADGEVTKQLYYYSDNQWRDENGRIFFPVAEHEWDMEGVGQYVWYDDPSYIDQSGEPYPTGDELTLYRADGEVTKQLYYYSDDQWRDENGRIFFPVAEHEWDMEGAGQYVWYDDPSYINY